MYGEIGSPSSLVVLHSCLFQLMVSRRQPDISDVGSRSTTIVEENGEAQGDTDTRDFLSVFNVVTGEQHRTPALGSAEG